MKYDCIDEYTLDPVHITLIGGRGSGKTSLLGAMYHEILQNPSMGIRADDRTVLFLREIQSYLVEYLNGNNFFTGDGESHDFLFYLKARATNEKRRFIYPFVFTDLPSGLFNDYNVGAYTEVASHSFQRSTAVILTIDAPALMSEEKIHNHYNSPFSIFNCLNPYFSELKKGSTVLFVLMRCEAYIQSPELRNELFERVRKKYKAHIDFLAKNNIDCLGTWVETLGGVHFTHYENDGCRQMVPVYKTVGPYSPRNCETPLLLTLKQCTKTTKQKLEENMKSFGWRKLFRNIIGRKYEQLAVRGLSDVIERLDRCLGSVPKPNTFNLLSSDDEAEKRAIKDESSGTNLNSKRLK